MIVVHSKNVLFKCQIFLHPNLMFTLRVDYLNGFPLNKHIS
jgi:hypothetical protein